MQPRDLTRLLERWRQGDLAAAEEATPLVYQELRSIARRLFRTERKDHTLQATAVVHEAYMRLSDSSGIKWRDRHQFYGFCAHLMRRILVHYSRQRGAAKRGGQQHRVELEEATLIDSIRPPDFLALDRALRVLDQNDSQKSQIVCLRIFAGLTIAETADYLRTSPRTINREWRKALAWLNRELSNQSPGPPKDSSESSPKNA